MSLEREPHQLTRHTDLLVRSPTPPSMDGLRAKGYRIRELILPHPAGGLYFEGITATKRIDGVKVQVYVGSDDGELLRDPGPDRVLANFPVHGRGPAPDRMAVPVFVRRFESLKREIINADSHAQSW